MQSYRPAMMGKKKGQSGCDLDCFIFMLFCNVRRPWGLHSRNNCWSWHPAMLSTSFYNADCTLTWRKTKMADTLDSWGITIFAVVLSHHQITLPLRSASEVMQSSKNSSHGHSLNKTRQEWQDTLSPSVLEEPQPWENLKGCSPPVSSLVDFTPTFPDTLSLSINKDRLWPVSHIHRPTSHPQSPYMIPPQSPSLLCLGHWSQRTWVASRPHAWATFWNKRVRPKWKAIIWLRWCYQAHRLE